MQAVGYSTSPDEGIHAWRLMITQAVAQKQYGNHRRTTDQIQNQSQLTQDHGGTLEELKTLKARIQPVSSGYPHHEINMRLMGQLS